MINSPKALFTPGRNIDPADIVGGEATLTETLLEDGKTPPFHTQLPFQFSPSVDALDAPDSSLPHLCKYASDATYLAIERNLPRDRLTAEDNMLF